jgi:hypothetical protein
MGRIKNKFDANEWPERLTDPLLASMHVIDTEFFHNIQKIMIKSV